MEHETGERQNLHTLDIAIGETASSVDGVSSL